MHLCCFRRQIKANGLVTVNTVVNYSLFDDVFDLRWYAGLIKPYDKYETEFKSVMLQSSDVLKTMENAKTANSSTGVYFNTDEK